jgi:hypothetical protein
LHFAIVSLVEELDAIDWYRQRADDAEDETLKQLLLTTGRERWSMPRCCSIHFKPVQLLVESDPNGFGGGAATASSGF